MTALDAVEAAFFSKSIHPWKITLLEISEGMRDRDDTPNGLDSRHDTADIGIWGRRSLRPYAGHKISIILDICNKPSLDKVIPQDGVLDVCGSLLLDGFGGTIGLEEC